MVVVDEHPICPQNIWEGVGSWLQSRKYHIPFHQVWTLWLMLIQEDYTFGGGGGVQTVHPEYCKDIKQPYQPLWMTAKHLVRL
jgi:hypothetical protein